ncbi:MAG: phosphotransferase, partial [Pseudomonadota bacterium]
LATYSPQAMTEQAGLVLEWYLSGVSGTVSERDKHSFSQTILDVLLQHASDADVLIQRDYHSENLLWLPDRVGLKRVGLLDFQDATRGHRMYDLVSLLQDARRDVPPDLEAKMLRRYAEGFGKTPQDDEVAYAVLGAQRNLRIIGVFARLGLRDEKLHYLDLMPRVWDLLMRNLAHPALTDLRQMTTDLLPAPSDAIRNTLRQQCAPTPMLS